MSKLYCLLLLLYYCSEAVDNSSVENVESSHVDRNFKSKSTVPCKL